jgi:hypothetical protein
MPPNHTNAPASTPNIIKRNKASANPANEGGIIAVSVEDVTPLAATSPAANVLAGDDIELETVAISTCAGRPDVFVSATAPVVESCQ